MTAKQQVRDRESASFSRCLPQRHRQRPPRSAARQEAAPLLPAALDGAIGLYTLESEVAAAAMLFFSIMRSFASLEAVEER